MRKLLIFIFCIMSCSALLIVPCMAAEPYTNYIYDTNGKSQAEPQAYIPQLTITGESLGIGAFKEPGDVFSSDDKTIYIADTGNNRIVVLNEDFTLRKVIDGFEGHEGKHDTFNRPRGIFVGKNICIADTDNARIVVLSQDGALVKILEEPQSSLVYKRFDYRPIRLCVDSADRIYVASLNTNQGLIELDAQGDFQSFFGAAKTTPTLAQALRRILPFESLKAGISLSIPTEYSSVALDRDGFVMGTVGIINPDTFSTDLFISRLGPDGDDILLRNGMHPPMGDVEFQKDEKTDAFLTSYLVDITTREDGMYAVLDQRMGRVFTYSFSGELLYIFGGIGQRDGLFGRPSALDILPGGRYIVADSAYNSLQIFAPTEYGALINEAVSSFFQRRFDDAGKAWRSALAFTTKSEMIFNAVADTEFKADNYSEAMRYYKLANNRNGYSQAFQNERNRILENAFPIIIAVIALIAALLFSRKFWHRKAKPHGRILTDIRKALYVTTHPFKGFWEIKSEKTGSSAISFAIVFLLIITLILQRQFGGFLINYSSGADMNLVVQFSYVLLPLFFWCAANWGITTLIDGEGTFREIFIVTSYGLLPMVLLGIPLLLAGNFFTLNEMAFYHLLNAIAILWSAALILTGIMTVHQFTIKKTIGSVIVAIVGMALLVGAVLLVISLVTQLFNFFTLVIKDFQMR